ncbi:MAG: hypothetical protein ABSB76_10405 [Streptosporangiaceae bacterium]
MCTRSREPGQEVGQQRRQAHHQRRDPQPARIPGQREVPEPTRPPVRSGTALGLLQLTPRQVPGF